MNAPQTGIAVVNRVRSLYAWWLALSVVILLFVAGTAPAQAQKPASGPMGFDEARHLLNRTSFAAQVSEINEFAKLTRGEAVDRLLVETRRQASYPPPAWSQTYERAYRPEMTQEERMKANRRELVCDHAGGG